MNKKHYDILMRGVDVWNKWRDEHEHIEPDFRWAKLDNSRLYDTNLSEVDFYQADLNGADLFRSDLQGANLFYTNLQRANLGKANLANAEFQDADLTNANLSDAILSNADLRSTNLLGAIFSGAKLNNIKLSNKNLTDVTFTNAQLNNVDLRATNLSRKNFEGTVFNGVNLRKADFSQSNLINTNFKDTNLSHTSFIGTNVENAVFDHCNIYGASVWDLKGTPKEQKDLIITPPGEPEVTVDNIKVAQFVYLLLENQEIRDVLDTIVAKAVLILGRFTKERKQVLDAIKEKLRQKGYLPILFDFEKPASKGYTETIKTLANLSRFVIADITDATEVRLELSKIVPENTSLPIQPIIQADKDPYVTFEDLKPYPWVLDLFHYPSEALLLDNMEEYVLLPAERKVAAIREEG